MTARTAQHLLASVFFILGGWCLIAPGMVMTVAFTPAYQSSDPVAPILVACFGAQAVIAGVFAAFSIFTRRTFLAFGLGLLPFFVFDYWFYAVEPMLTVGTSMLWSLRRVASSTIESRSCRATRSISSLPLTS